MMVRMSALSMPMPKAMVATITSMAPDWKSACTCLRRAESAGVVGVGGEIARQHPGQFFRHACGRRVDDGRAAARLAEISRARSNRPRAATSITRWRCFAAEAVDEAAGAGQPELGEDIVLHQRRGRAVSASTGAGRSSGRYWPSMR